MFHELESHFSLVLLVNGPENDRGRRGVLWYAIARKFKAAAEKDCSSPNLFRLDVVCLGTAGEEGAGMLKLTEAHQSYEDVAWYG